MQPSKSRYAQSSGFLNFCERTNVIFINPTEFIKEPQNKIRIKPVLTFEEMKRILDQPNLSTITGIRDRTILEVFYTTGIRLNELCSLTIYDADLQGGVLRINKGKGARDRVVPLGKHAVKFLRESYLQGQGPGLPKKTGPADPCLWALWASPCPRRL